MGFGQLFPVSALMRANPGLEPSASYAALKAAYDCWIPPAEVHLRVCKGVAESCLELTASVISGSSTHKFRQQPNAQPCSNNLQHIGAALTSWRTMFIVFVWPTSHPADLWPAVARWEASDFGRHSHGIDHPPGRPSGWPAKVSRINWKPRAVFDLAFGACSGQAARKPRQICALPLFDAR